MNPGAVSIMRFHFSVVAGSQLADQQAAARCRLMALFGHRAMSDLSPFSGVKRKSDFGAVRAAFDPKGPSTDRMAVDDYAALGSRLSIRLRSASKSMGLVSSASAPPANAFRSVSASP